MGIVAGLLKRCGYVPARTQRRNMFSPNKQRLYDWVWKGTSADADIKATLAKARSISREICSANPHARKFLNLLAANVIGPSGIGLQVKASEPNGTPDNLANAIIERAWVRGGRVGRYTADGRLSRAAAQSLIIKAVARDGEVLVRQVRDSSRPGGYTRQIIESDLLDERRNEARGSNTNEVRMGVEVDTWGRPVAYHLRTRHPGDGTYDLVETHTERVPADEILHLYIMERPGQTRGIPWFLPVAERMKMLAGYAEAELIAARTAAAKMGFFESINPDGYDGEQDVNGNLVLEASPGTMEQLPPGVSFKPWDPQHPTSAYDSFTKSILREISAGLGCSYTGLSGDLEGVNFSSIRQGVLDERDMWMMLQNWWVDHYERPDFEAWLKMGLLTGDIPLPAAKYDKFNAPAFQPRRWSWVDPLKDISAAGYAVALGVKSRTQIAAEQGSDLDDVLAEIKAEQELAASYGVTLQNPALPNVPQQQEGAPNA